MSGPDDFETHLVDCVTCTDEFAAISEARFSVFEWQKEEFAHMPTPEFTIPYEQKARVAEPVFAGLLAGIRDLLGGAMWPAAVAASLLAVVGIGYLATSSPQKEIATNTKAVERKVPVPAETNKTLEAGKTTQKSLPVTPEKAVSPQKAENDVRAVKASYKTPRPNRQMTAERVRPEILNSVPDQKTRKVPALSSFDEEDDNTLRLADLFDDGGA